MTFIKFQVRNEKKEKQNTEVFTLFHYLIISLEKKFLTLSKLKC